MSDLSREQRLNVVFVKLADTLVDDYDTVELLQYLVESCAELLDTDAGGLMLADSSGQLQAIASTGEAAELVEIMQLNAGMGPCVECFTTGEAVSVPDIDTVQAKWPDFAQAAAAGGFHSVYATPLRLRGKTVGAMNLFSIQVGKLNDRDIATARALTDIATIGIMQERLVRESSAVTEQLQHALDSRVLIEQAKGVLSEAHSIPLEEAFTWLRDHARRNQTSLRTLAESIATRTLDPATISARPATKKRP
ncbi:GAF and ANTAR domain-containing protein [Planctomonas psychrotolerans]|uniref:GAF and ANTAR domain-containing protein n=1 Tax=Planctomonas psychrotolerans TaxID=2528712 RepID=UPI00123AA25B|nr:GAF and ANTAR domain-containing protein [Planctomonas psychrotolerans]